MVREAIAENGERFGVVTRVPRQLGIGPESLRNWVKHAEMDEGKRPGVTSEERRRIAELEKENRELRRANQILKSASACSRLTVTRRVTSFRPWSPALVETPTCCRPRPTAAEAAHRPPTRSDRRKRSNR